MVKTDNPRLQILYSLSQGLGTKDPELTYEDLCLEKWGSMYLPTIGSEIEVSWKSVLDDYDFWFNEPYSDFSPEKKKAFDERCDRLDSELTPMYKLTESLGVPRGKGKYHEFSNKPVNWYKTLALENRILFESGLIPEDHSLAFHITLGGIDWGVDAGLATTVIELSGGSSPERLMEPKKGKLSWDRGIVAGIKERYKNELEGRYSNGIEIKTLIADNPEQIEKTLRYSQMLHTAIRSYQGHAPKTVISSELSDIWKDIKGGIKKEILVPNGLNRWWTRPSSSKMEWNKFCDLYNKPETREFLYEIASRVDNIENLIVESIIEDI